MTSDENKPSIDIDFSSILAAAVHDMKNSLCLLIQSIDQINGALPDDQPDVKQQVASLHYEANRMNTGLVQILSLYRAQREKLPLTIDLCFIDDVIADVIASNQLYAKQKSITVNYHCDEELSWYLDMDLVYLLINDVLINALRYGTSQIMISAKDVNGELLITVEDDGDGYPESMLINSESDPTAFTVSQGRTGLGLYFANMIAQAHQNKLKHGSISLRNGGLLKGSVFELKIP